MGNNDATPPVNGEFTFYLTEKRDRNGDAYMFGGLQLFNVVVFAFPEPSSTPDEPRRWKMVVRPYTGPRPDSGVWTDERKPQR